MEKQNEMDKRILTIKKTFNIPRQTVWNAWTKPEHLAQWWAPPGMKTTIELHDLKIGGNWKYTIPMPDGSQFISEGVYEEIIVPEKIVTTANFRPMTEGVIIHLLFEEMGDKTEFTFSVAHPTEEYCKQQEKMGFYNGWGTAFIRLEKILEGFNK